MSRMVVPRAVIYIAWLIVVPIATTLLLLLVGYVTAFPPVTMYLNAFLLVVIGFLNVRFMPGRRFGRLALLPAIPIVMFIFFIATSTPRNVGFNAIVCLVAGVLVLAGGITALLLEPRGE